jgi:hypothetical protein
MLLCFDDAFPGEFCVFRIPVLSNIFYLFYAACDDMRIYLVIIILV